MRVLAIDATSSALWVGGWESLNDIGLLAAYTDKWQPVTAVSETVRAIALDEEGNAWVGTWGGGVYRHDSTVADVNGGWTQYTVKDGLASDEIYDIVIDGNTVWVAANSYKSNGQSFGGVSSFNQMSGQWRTFAQPHGLPADPRDASLPAPMYAVAVGANQDIWVGTVAIVNGAEADAVYRLITSDLWVQDSTEANNRVHALAVVGNNVIAAGNSRMLHLDQSMTPGSPPTVQMQTEPMTITLDATLVLTATATDQDEGGGTILGWEWTSERAGHICTTAERCVIPSQILGEGMHQIGLRVQDDEGIWSQKEAVQIVVTVPPEQPEETIYLPLIRR